MHRVGFYYTEVWTIFWCGQRNVCAKLFLGCVVRIYGFALAYFLPKVMLCMPFLICKHKAVYSVAALCRKCILFSFCISNFVSAFLIDFKTQDQADSDNFLSCSPICKLLMSSNNVLFHFLCCVTLLTLCYTSSVLSWSLNMSKYFVFYTPFCWPWDFCPSHP